MMTTKLSMCGAGIKQILRGQPSPLAQLGKGLGSGHTEGPAREGAHGGKQGSRASVMGENMS